MPHDGIAIRRFDPPMYSELNVVHRASNRSSAKVLLLDVLAELAELQTDSWHGEVVTGPGQGVE
ncbi:MAG: hypothetical protein EOO67_20920 [Microbacterium sp.]|nr:MAG: hypothetical protein EOO67_20920 [Microbacterium sp.]